MLSLKFLRSFYKNLFKNTSGRVQKISLSNITKKLQSNFFTKSCNLDVWENFINKNLLLVWCVTQPLMNLISSFTVHSSKGYFFYFSDVSTSKHILFICRKTGELLHSKFEGGCSRPSFCLKIWKPVLLPKSNTRAKAYLEPCWMTVIEPC